MSLTITFWGTRGSVPAPGPATVRYGGNTPCVEVRGHAGLLILDAGTGIRALGRTLMERSGSGPVTADILISHPHWDHIQGLPFFAPIFRAPNRVTLWTPDALKPQLERALREQMAPGVFPVSLRDLAAEVGVRGIDGPLDRNGITVTTLPVAHPGGSTAYKLADHTNPGRVLVYVSDNELVTGAGHDGVPDERALASFARGVAVLVHDAMYTNDEYERHRGWGHSRDTDALNLAIAAGVERLVLFHHNPDRSDDALDARVQALRERAAGRVVVSAAAEGETMEV